MKKPAPSVTIKDQEDGRTRLRVQFDITYKGSPGKKVQGESHTEPDMTLTLGQLLERHSRGKDIPMKEPIYFETEVPTFSDLTDVERYKDQLQRRLEETKKFIQDERHEADKSKNAKTSPNKAQKKAPVDEDSQTPEGNNGAAN